MPNILEMKEVCPDITSSLMVWYEVMVNGFLSVVILIIQVIVLTKQDNLISYVLSSIVTKFILQLNDNAEFLDDDGDTDLHRRMLIKEVADSSYLNQGLIRVWIHC